eukprot:3697014-Amphidinium_carterae.1
MALDCQVPKINGLIDRYVDIMPWFPLHGGYGTGQVGHKRLAPAERKRRTQVMPMREQPVEGAGLSQLVSTRTGQYSSNVSGNRQVCECPYAQSAQFQSTMKSAVSSCSTVRRSWVI